MAIALPQSVSALCEQIEREAGKIDVLVNNAGIVKDSLFASMSYEDFTQVIETNMFSIFRLTKRRADAASCGRKSRHY